MLEAEGVSVRLGGRVVLRDVSLRVRTGEVVAVVGPNGAGKSTLVSCLSGASRPWRGRVRLDGDEPAALRAPELARRRAVLEQTPEIGAPFRLRELVGIAIPQAVPPAEARRIEIAAMAAVELESLAERSVHRLSGGERHRAHMARALAQLAAGRWLGGGRWLLLDEPTASLDLRHQASVLHAARRAAAEGAGVLAVLHDLTLAAAVADRIVIMDRGEVAAAGPPREVLTPDRLSRIYGLQVAVTETAPDRLAVVPAYGALRALSHKVLD
jgi:iron complex transport system ATP-binding protein